MNRKLIVLFMVCVAVLLSGCNTTDSLNITTGPPAYTDYSPGYTGKTQGYDGYGNYNDGYGPSFWNPRYYFYANYNQGYAN